MDLNKRRTISSRAYAPFYKESLYCFRNFVCLFLLLLIVFSVFAYLWGHKFLWFFFVIVVFYVLVDCLLNYRLTFVSMYENKKCDWVSQELTIKKISKSFSWSSPWYASTMSKLYSKELNFDRYNIICTNNLGEKVVLKTAISGKKYQIIQNRIFENLCTKCYIYYGKYSKIIMFYKNSENWTDQLNHMI